ncbi:MAG: D-TA family PLP-dependent enzyme, partial [Mesorhizobium sp.]
LSEEHGTVTLAHGAALGIGERVRVVPDHCCVVTNLFDQVHLIDGDKVLETLPVAARGKMG